MSTIVFSRTLRLSLLYTTCEFSFLKGQTSYFWHYCSFSIKVFVNLCVFVCILWCVHFSPNPFSIFSLCLSRSKVPEFIKMMSDHFLWWRFHDNPAINQTCCCFSLTNQILWNFSLTNQISLFLSSRLSSLILFTFLSVFCREHKLPSHISRFRHSAAEVNWMLLCWDVKNGHSNMAATKWQFVGAFDTKWQKWTRLWRHDPRNSSSCTTCFIRIPS